MDPSVPEKKRTRRGFKRANAPHCKASPTGWGVRTPTAGRGPRRQYRLEPRRPVRQQPPECNLRAAFGHRRNRFHRHPTGSEHRPIHLVGTASSPGSPSPVRLANGIESMGARFSRCVNRVFGRRGAVPKERFHHVVKRTPTEVRRALAYVLLNIRKHYRQRRRRIPPVVLDGRWPATTGRPRLAKSQHRRQLIRGSRKCFGPLRWHSDPHSMNTVVGCRPRALPGRKQPQRLIVGDSPCSLGSLNAPDVDTLSCIPACRW